MGSADEGVDGDDAVLLRGSRAANRAAEGLRMIKVTFELPLHEGEAAEVTRGPFSQGLTTEYDGGIMAAGAELRCIATREIVALMVGGMWWLGDVSPNAIYRRMFIQSVED